MTIVPWCWLFWTQTSLGKRKKHKKALEHLQSHKSNMRRKYHSDPMLTFSSGPADPETHSHLVSEAFYLRDQSGQYLAHVLCLKRQCFLLNTCSFSNSVYSKNSNDTQNTVSRSERFPSLSHCNTKRRALKTAFIPEKEYNYSSMQNSRHIPFLSEVSFPQNKWMLATVWG